MARLLFSAHTGGEVALVAATAKTVLQVLAPANQMVAVRSVAMSFDGVAGNAEPVVIEVTRQTTAGTMSSGTKTKMRPGSAAIQTTVTRDASAPPTAGDSIFYENIHPQTGVEFRWAPDEDVVLDGGERLGLRITAPANVNVIARFLCEE